MLGARPWHYLDLDIQSKLADLKEGLPRDLPMIVSMIPANEESCIMTTIDEDGCTRREKKENTRMSLSNSQRHTISSDTITSVISI